MNPPPRSHLWQTADLVPNRGRWLAAADRSLGDAQGLLAPVRPDGNGGWRVAARPDVVFLLAPVTVDELRELRYASGGEDAAHYLCLLRYDHPEDRPGSCFLVGVDPARGAGAQPREPVVARHERAATVEEVQAALDTLWRQLGPGLQRRFVSAPAEPAPIPAPAPAESVRFLFASCQYPAGMMDREDANRSYQALARRLQQGMAPPERILLLGDQVYTDATYGLLDPASLDDRYRLPYEQLVAPDGPWAQLPQDLRRLMCMTPDDHEIVNDWEPWAPGAAGERHERGLAAYWRYQRGENAPLPRLWQTLPEPHAAAAGWRVFMADTRSTRQFRSDRTLHDPETTILGPDQTLDLEDWLRAAPGDLKIVTSAALLLPRSRIGLGEPLRLDNWQGYPSSFHRLLAFVCDEQVENLVFLSGDLHLGISAQVTVRNTRTGREVHFSSHHAPALYAPYPFANESLWNLQLEDCFTFAWARHGGAQDTYEVTVRGTVLDEDQRGWGQLEARRTAGGWTTEVTFLPN